MWPLALTFFLKEIELDQKKVRKYSFLFLTKLFGRKNLLLWRRLMVCVYSPSLENDCFGKWILENKTHLRRVIFRWCWDPNHQCHKSYSVRHVGSRLLQNFIKWKCEKMELGNVCIYIRHSNLPQSQLRNLQMWAGFQLTSKTWKRAESPQKDAP